MLCSVLARGVHSALFTEQFRSTRQLALPLASSARGVWLGVTTRDFFNRRLKYRNELWWLPASGAEPRLALAPTRVDLAPIGSVLFGRKASVSFFL